MPSLSAAATALLLLFLSALATADLDNEEVVMKRRIGMRLPNLLALRDTSPMMEKRRIGMRLPNIIYLRGDHTAEKKFSPFNW